MKTKIRCKLFWLVFALSAGVSVLLWSDLWIQLEDMKHHATELLQTRLRDTTRYSSMIVYNPQERNNFQLLLDNPDLCDDVSLSYVIYVYSGANYFKKRHVLRTTWLNEEFLKARNMKRLFFIGRRDGKDSRKVQDLIKAENDIYHDIIQGDFHDTYQNISLKGLMVMKWMSTYCSHAKMLIKMDDDVNVDIIQLLDQLLQYEGHIKTLICTIKTTSPIQRGSKSCKRKWCLDPKLLPNMTIYPKYCSGPLYSMTPDLPKLLYEASTRAEFLWVEDAYFTGVLPEAIGGITYTKQKKGIWKHGQSPENILNAWTEYWKSYSNTSQIMKKRD